MGRKQRVGSIRERLYGEVFRNTVRGEGDCKNPMGCSMYDGLMETFEFIWVNIWCMLD